MQPATYNRCGSREGNERAGSQAGRACAFDGLVPPYPVGGKRRGVVSCEGHHVRECGCSVRSLRLELLHRLCARATLPWSYT